MINSKIINTKEHEKKIREDPVTEISRTMKSRRNEILSNPLKMKRIYDEARLVKDERDNKKALRALIKKKEKLEKKIYGRH